VTDVSHLSITEQVAKDGYVGRPIAFPRDALREVTMIPRGAGYTPCGNKVVDVYEAASLQERARADHQRTLRVLLEKATAAGGQCWYNNNIDLFVRLGDERLLVEAKSLIDPRDAVDRMRYGLGQLTDYGVRYKAEVGHARPVLAFGNPPTRETSWIATILESVGIAFVVVSEQGPQPLNEPARQSRFLSPEG
jgi:hypothetical protein